jgi:predicted PolB exonuclease-like 3'-5' exonuclease
MPPDATLIPLSPCLWGSGFGTSPFHAPFQHPNPATTLGYGLEDMGLPGKPNGITGADVERYYREGRIREIADYCESDVLNTYRLWLRYELFRGGLSIKHSEQAKTIWLSS